LIGNEVPKRKKPKPALDAFKSLRTTYSPPQLDFNTTTTVWHVDEWIRARVHQWRALTGEDGQGGSRSGSARDVDSQEAYSGTYSVFPIPLAEWILMRYAGPVGNTVLDLFAGGPPRAVATSIMDYKYTGIDVRGPAIEENIQKLTDFGLVDNCTYHHGDARYIRLDEEFDFGFTCPPYYDLEVYSDQEDDFSNFNSYQEFDVGMYEVAQNYYRHLKPGALCCVVQGQFRDKKSNLVDFRGDTVGNFQDAGFNFFQDIVLIKSFGSAAVRSVVTWKGRKLIPRHEYLLVFEKPA
jgi:DNA modification methylase